MNNKDDKLEKSLNKNDEKIEKLEIDEQPVEIELEGTLDFNGDATIQQSEAVEEKFENNDGVPNQGNEKSSLQDGGDTQPSLSDASQEETKSTEEPDELLKNDSNPVEQTDDRSENQTGDQKNDNNESKEQSPGEKEDQKNDDNNSNAQDQSEKEDQKNDNEESKEEQKDDAANVKDRQNQDEPQSQQDNKQDDLNKSDERKKTQDNKDEKGADSNDNTFTNKDDGNKQNDSGKGKPKEENESNLDKKRDQAKQKDNNRRSKGNKNNSPKKGGNLKNKAKNAAKNYANNKLNNNAAVQKAQELKNKYDKAKNTVKGAKKAAQATTKAVKNTVNLIKMIAGGSSVATVILIIFIIIIVIAIASSFLVPGAFGDYGESESSYSKTDQKTLKKINELVLKYPNADATLAMATVVYPYYDFLWSANVSNYISDDYDDELSDETFEEVEEGENTEDIEEEKDEKSDDAYLELFKKYSYRNKLKKLLKQLNSGDENAYFEYLKTDYFKSESAYKSMFSGVSDPSALENAIIEDLKSVKSYFQNYVGKSYSCSVNMQSAGTVEVSDMIKNGNILIDVKEENCTSGKYSELSACASWNESPITLKEYVKGVTYTEITVDESTSIDRVKAQMIMVKSYVLGRYKAMGWETTTDENGNYIIPIRANTNDQDYCDYNVGCIDKRSGNKHGPASDAVKALLDKAYDETVNEYIYNKEEDRMYASYRAEYDDMCIKGSCLATTDLDLAISSGLNYQQILTSAFTNSTLINLDTSTGIANAQVSGEMVCTEIGNGTGVPDDKFIYYSQTDPSWKDTQFCGRSDGTIGSSGCGVTSMAMVISTLSNTTVTPLDTMAEAYDIGYCGYGIVGTSASYFLDVAHDYELTVTTLTKDSNGKEKALQTLRNGGLIIANVGSNSPFTTGGHYIVIRRIASGRMVYVGDPNHQELFNTSYSIDDFIDKGWVTNGWWAFIGPKSTEYSTLSGSPGVATGNFVNPFNPNDVTTTYTNEGNAASFPKYNSGDCHGGVDISVSQGTPIFALDGGIVKQVGDYNSNCYGENICDSGWNSYGIYVLIDHGNDYQTVYAHLNQRLVNIGDKVSKGEMIGYSGDTGNSTGPHIHLELRDLSKYSSATRDAAKCSSGKGLMNVTKYINTGVSYVGGAE